MARTVVYSRMAVVIVIEFQVEKLDQKCIRLHANHNYPTGVSTWQCKLRLLAQCRRLVKDEDLT